MKKLLESHREHMDVSQIRDRGLKVPAPSEADVQSLVDSIKQVGHVIQAIVVRPAKDEENTHEVVVGQARFEAVKELGHETIPAISMELDDEQSLIMALAENYCRRQTQPVTTATYLKQLQGRGMSLRDIGAAMGCSHQTVSNYLSLLDLPAAIQGLVDDESLSMTAALKVDRELSKLLEKAESLGLGLTDEEQKILRQTCWSDVRKKLDEGGSLSGSEAVKLVQGKLTAEGKAKLLGAVERKKSHQEDKEQEEVGPQHGGYSVLQCRLPKKALLDVLGSQLQDEEKVTLTFTSESLFGPAEEVALVITPTMECSVSLHSSYAHALYLMVECPDTRGKEITLTMSKRSSHLQITSSGEAGLDCKLPAHLLIAQDHTEVHEAEEVQACIPSAEEGVYCLRPASMVMPPKARICGSVAS